MVYLVKKRLVDILFIISSFIFLFEITFSVFGELTDMLVYFLFGLIWVISGLLIGLHELNDVLLDYIGNKQLAKKLILLSKIIVWTIIIALLVLFIKDII